MENLQVTETMRDDLLSGSSWLKFLTIMAAIGMVLLVFAGIAMLFVPYIDRSLRPAGIIYFIVALLYIYPIIKSFSLSSNIKSAMRENSQYAFEDAADDFRSILKYTGILVIACLCLYVLVFVFAIAVAAMH